MVDRVRPLKMESPASGGTQTDEFPTGTDPNEDHLEARGLFLQDDVSQDDQVHLTRDASDRLTFQDGDYPSALTLTETALPYSAEETADGGLSTSSSTPVNATGMSITLPAGTFLAFFSAKVSGTKNGSIPAIDLALDGTSIDFSERAREVAVKDQPDVLAVQARFTATAGQVLTGRYWNQGLGNAEITERTLTVIQVR